MIGLLLALTPQYEVLPCSFGSDYQPVPQATLQAMYGAEISPYFAFQSGNLFRPSFNVREWKTAPAQTGPWQAIVDCVAAHNPPLATGYVIHSAQNIGTYSLGMPQMGLLIEGQTVSAQVAIMLRSHLQDPAAISHEIGHMLALGHTGNSDNDADPYDSPWDLMSDFYQYAVPYNRTGKKPKSLAAVQRKQLGWIEHSLTLTSGTHEIGLVPVGQYGTQAVQIGPYTIEAKRQAGYDMNLPAEGVLVYNDVRLTDTVDYSNGPNSVLTPGESATYANFTVTVHELYRITVAIDNSLFKNGFEP